MEHVGFPNVLAVRIRRARVARGLSIEAAARRSAGLVSRSLWSNYERGVEPGLSRFLAICLALDLRPDRLLPRAAASLVRGRRAGREAVRAALAR